MIYRRAVLYCIQILFLTGGICLQSYAQKGKNVPADSAAVPRDTTAPNVDSTRLAVVDSLRMSSDIEAPIEYGAEDSMVLDLKTNSLRLFRTAHLHYDQMTLEADSVAVDWNAHLLYATGLMDTSGQIRGRPLFKDGEGSGAQSYHADTVKYNFSTQRGLVKGARTQDGDQFVLGDAVKKDSGDVYYVRNGKFTTCDLEHPHFYIESTRLKVIPKDRIISGPLRLVIEDFPLPFILPFGFFPNQSGQRSGIVLPTYGEASDRGFFLRNGGYYWAVNDHFDLLFRGDIFTRGGYRIEGSTSYNKRYRFSGTFGLEYAKQKYGEQQDPGYREEKTFFVRWSHDQKMNPQTSLRASVNAGSSNFLSNNSYNEQEYLTNTLKSNITFTHTFPNSPYSLTVNLDQTQNNSTRQMTMNLPNVALTRTRWMPFKNVGKTGTWYRKLGMSYNFNFRNQISGPDSLIGQALTNPFGTIMVPTILEGDTTYDEIRSIDYYRNGMTHRIPINTSFSLAKYININPSFNYAEYWYFRTTEKSWINDSLITANNYGFAAARDFNLSVNAQTRLYNTRNFGGPRQFHIRHTLIPTIGYTFKPDFSKDFWGFYNTVQVDTSGETQTYSRFSNGIFGGPSAGEQQRINFGFSNVLEAKMLKSQEAQDSAKTEKDKWQYLTLSEQFGISSSYNFAADSLNLAQFACFARTNLLRKKVNLQVTATFDPYAIGPEFQRINTFRVVKNGRLARLSSFSFVATGSVRSKKRTGEKKTEDVTEDDWANINYYRNLYVDFTVPWTLNLNAKLSYTNTGALRDTTASIGLNGDVNLTPKWKIAFTANYDFTLNDFTYTSLSIYRDLHCWEMSVTWIPFGKRTSYNFGINVKSSTLSDLKLTKRRDWQDRFREF